MSFTSSAGGSWSMKVPAVIWEARIGDKWSVASSVASLFTCKQITILLGYMLRDETLARA